MRKTALVIAIILLIGMLPINGMAETETILFNERFDDTATNALSQKIFHNGDKNARVMPLDINNKAFMMAGDITNLVEASFSNTRNTTVFSAKIKMVGSNSRFSFSFTDNSKTFTPITIDKDGVILTHDGKKIGGLARGAFTTIQIGYNAKSRKYFVVQDGKLKVSGWRSGSSVGIPVKFSISTSYVTGSEPGTIYLDDIAVYNGDGIIDKLPEVPFNKEVVEFTPILPGEVGSEIILTKDYEDNLLSGFSMNAKDNSIEIRKEKNGNRYMHVYKNTKTDAYFNISDLSEYGKYIVVEADVKRPSGSPMVRLFSMRDEDGVSAYVSTLQTNGNITLPDGTVAVKTGNEWVSIAAACDLDRMCFDFYVNGQLIAKNSPMSNPSLGQLASIRTYFEANDTGEVGFDNIFVYEGTELKDIEIEHHEDTTGFDIKNTVLPDINRGENVLRGKYAMHLYSNFFYSKDHRIKLPYDLYVNGDVAMMPVNVLGDYMGYNASLSGEILTIDDKEIRLSAAPVTMNGLTYIPVMETFTSIGKVCFEHDDGLIVISDEKIDFADNETIAFDANKYMFFDRKSAEELKEVFRKSGAAGKHPRVLANADTFARLRKEIKTNRYIAEWNETVMEEADKYLSSPVHEYIIPDGLRLLDTSRGVLDYMLALGYAYQITGNRKYARRVWEELYAVGQFKDWNPYHFLDTGEMTAAFAVGYDWCYDEFSEDEKKYIEDAIINLGLLEGKKYYEGIVSGVTFFVNSEFNWNPVCNGGLAVGAMAIADKHPDIAFYTIECALRSIEKSVVGFAPDGGWGEGVGYWGYTLRYFIYFMDSLKNTFGTDFGVPGYIGISNTDMFVINLHGNTTANGFHDSFTNLSITEYCFWLAKYFKKPDVTGLRLQVMKEFGVKGTVKDLLWYDSEVSEIKSFPPLDGITKGTESGSMRSSWADRNGMYVSYHGGETDVGHYHLDHGSFVVDMSGIRWAIDIGAENYSGSGYFGSKRPTFYRVRSEGHNTLVINPSEEGGQDMDAFCPIIKTASKEGSAYQILDMSSAYKQKVYKALRGFMLTNGRRTFTVQDEFSLKEESEVYWFMHTYANVEIVDNNTAILTQDGVKMQVKILTDAPESELSVMDARPLPTSPDPDGQSKNSGIRKLALRLKANGDVMISARITPLSENGADKEFVVKKIADWEPDDSKVIDIPEAQMMYIDGVEVREFSPKRAGYGTSLPYDYKELPVPTLSAPGMVVETIPATSPNEEYRFKVYKPEDPENYRIYGLTYTVLPKLDDVFGYKRYTPAKIYASAVPEEENTPEDTVDQDLITRWAAPGNQWIEQDLGSVKPVDAVAVAFSKGQSRNYIFKIEVSNDGENYVTVFDGKSGGAEGGFGENLELFKFENRVNARYIRYSGSGNNSNRYNTLLEYAVLADK